MLEAGDVVKLSGETAYVRFKRGSACGKCSACGMLKDMSEHVIDVNNSVHAGVGDKVLVEFATKHGLASSAIAYIFPLIMLVLGVILGYIIGNAWFSDPQVVAAIAGIVFTALAFFTIKLIEPILKRRVAGTFKLIKIIEDKETDNG